MIIDIIKRIEVFLSYITIKIKNWNSKEKKLAIIDESLFKEEEENDDNNDDNNDIISLIFYRI